MFGVVGTIGHSNAAQQGILNEVWKHKLIFVETPDANETSIALENYRRVCHISMIGLASVWSYMFISGLR